MNILHIDCSPRAGSHSRKLSMGIVERLLLVNPSSKVTRRDLGQHPLPHTQADYATALSSADQMASGIANGAMQLSELLISEVEAADTLVIGTPMNNFTVPSVLKAWVDQILRMGRTIGSSKSGAKIGLLQDKPVFIAIASGGVFSGERANQPDFLTPYMTAALNCVGLNSVHFLALQATAFRDVTQLAGDRDDVLASLDISPCVDV